MTLVRVNVKVSYAKFEFGREIKDLNPVLIENITVSEYAVVLQVTVVT